MAELVWFKRDLRVADHVPLLEASRRGEVVCLYGYEPEYLESPEFDASHLTFINQSLEQLAQALEALGGQLVTRVGNFPQLLSELAEQVPIDRIWAHEETGTMVTFKRDIRVRRWARERGIPMLEVPQTGVVRRLKSRDGWASIWEKRMRLPVQPKPERLFSPQLPSAGILKAEHFELDDSQRPEAQRGGEERGQAVLESFLSQRGSKYHKDLSSPVTAWDGCSRLSPYLTWGNLSLRQIFQAAERQRRRNGWARPLKSFIERLHWHCHFIQKLEDEPAIEFENMNRGYDGLRENDFRQDWFDLWCRGETGYPLVDACMRALHKSGWINFRMRAMLVSFATYHLWLHWRQPAVFLARHFLDFEPGIHFSQFQMQAGTTGINSLRIYNPIKQQIDQDPDGIFIKRYLPELEGVPKAYLVTPHKMPPSIQRQAGCRIDVDYPAPVVEHLPAYRAAKKKIDLFRKRPEVERASRRVLVKHGSRRKL